MSNLILEEIIALKNQKELYLIKDEEGVFSTTKKSYANTQLHLYVEEILPKTQCECNLQCKVKFVQNFSLKCFAEEDLSE